MKKLAATIVVVGAISIVCGIAIFWVFENKTIEYKTRNALMSETDNKVTIDLWVFLKYTSKKDFIAGQKIHVDAVLRFPTKERYLSVKESLDQGDHLFIVFYKSYSLEEGHEWGEGGVITDWSFKTTNSKEYINPEGEEIYIAEGSTDLMYQAAGEYEYYIDTKLGGSTITIHPKSREDDIRKSNLTVMLMFIAIGIATIGLGIGITHLGAHRTTKALLIT